MLIERDAGEFCYFPCEQIRLVLSAASCSQERSVALVEKSVLLRSHPVVEKSNGKIVQLIVDQLE